jgi:hypothetical protein
VTAPTAAVSSGIPLRLLGWVYDETADMILGHFTDAPASDDPNPAAFAPTLRYVVAMEVIGSEVYPLDEPPVRPVPEPDPA